MALLLNLAIFFIKDNKIIGLVNIENEWSLILIGLVSIVILCGGIYAYILRIIGF